jgi:3-oxoadipate enol-lactonase
MPNIRINGSNLHYESRGSGSETIVFSHGFLWSGEMFREQVSALEDHYRCIMFDHRGQGQSEVTDNGYSIDSITLDAIGLIEALDCAPCHFAGLSMGGFVGLRIAIRRPDLLKSLILMESSCTSENEATIRQYRLLGFIARWFGLGIVAGKVMPIMFGQKFLKDPKRIGIRKEWKTRMVSNNRIGITRALSGVVDRTDISDQLEKINLPTLIIVGEDDTALPVEQAEIMHKGIHGSKLVIIPNAGHTSTVEEPVAVTSAIKDFLHNLGT